MDYKTGLFSSLFRNTWRISTEREALVCKQAKTHHRIPYFDIRGVRIEKGLFWDTVTATTADQSLHLEDLSGKVARSLSQDIKSRTKETIIAHVLSNEGVLPEVDAQVKKLLHSNRYIAQSDIRNWVSQTPDIGQDLAHPYFDAGLLPQEARMNLEAFVEISKPDSLILKQTNENFVQREMDKFAHLFRKLEEYPLSEEQMRAAVINEDRNLLIAAAGSGKSSTIVAKAIYLVSAGLARPEEILILAFNKDAQVEVEQRLVDLLGVAPEYQTPLKVKTFHGLGYEILSKTEETRPSISKFSTGGRKTQTEYFTDLIRHLYVSDPGFMAAWQKFLIVNKYPNPNIFAVKSKKEYEEYLEELGAKRKMMPSGIQLTITTIDGKEVRSIEEARIANWLVLKGIEYEYERQYVNPNEPNASINYLPDFYYPGADVYHEHFAINSEGKTPDFIDNRYVDEMEFKRKSHQENGTTLIETLSAHFCDGTVFERLEQSLREHGVPFNPLTRSEINSLVRQAFNPDVDCHIFISFMHHFKANHASIYLLKDKARDLPDQGRVSLFLRLFG